jgi:hypothetical protein
LFSAGDLVRVIKDPPTGRLYSKDSVAIVESVLVSDGNQWPKDYWTGLEVKCAILIHINNITYDWTSPGNLELVFQR